MITEPCIKEKCTMWHKCSYEKKYIKEYFEKKGRKAPEWKCRFPFPGANMAELSILTKYDVIDRFNY